ncbi:lysine transporter LysE [Paenibacillus agaridevorans]|uniref:Lysine transporter LysE n=1 Tax=Paenibacillus agaridevorans TaxID=171404 RepID=A0A2R5ENE5_9BACL|nr:LysE family transporter [Paenibacillus agaridevorans]GBG07179.1 lysine transporter LysE [Paenibacillus agaridevorans]
MDITSFLIYCVIATFTPGPTNIMILSTVNNQGTKKAMEYTFGATSGFCFLLIISAVLNSILVTFLPKIVIMMQLIGSCYMLYLAVLIYKRDASIAAVNQKGTFLSGVIMQFLNPKVMLFALTVLPTFILPKPSSSTAISLSIIGITIIGFLAFVTWVLFGSLFKTFLQKHKKTVNVAMSFSLVYAAVMIWI